MITMPSERRVKEFIFILISWNQFLELFMKTLRGLPTNVSDGCLKKTITKMNEIGRECPTFVAKNVCKNDYSGYVPSC